MKRTKTYLEIQHELVERYRIRLNPKSKCYSRMHVHPKVRMICKWNYKNSAEATFELLHEIGHIENNTSKMRRAEEEYYATVWALEKCREYGVEVPQRIFQRYQEYIDREKDRGIRRGGQAYGELRLPA